MPFLQCFFGFVQDLQCFFGFVQDLQCTEMKNPIDSMVIVGYA